MSLFYTPREVRLITSRKRKKGDEPQKLYYCHWCSDGYESETELHLHKKSKHRGALATLIKHELNCQICLQKQDDNEQMVKHIKSRHLFSSEDAEHVEREIFICNICNLIYFNKQMLAVHIKYSHEPANKLKAAADCPKCGKLVQIKHVWFHFQRHLIQSVACCPICLKKCKDQKDLLLHTKEHPNYYHCNLCAYDTKTREYFISHTKTHMRNVVQEENEIVTNRCFIQNPILRKYDFNFGLRGLRLPNFLEVCILCRAICTPEDKSNHVLQYHSVDPVVEKKQYACTCGEVFYNHVLLKHHVFKLKGNHKSSEVRVEIVEVD